MKLIRLSFHSSAAKRAFVRQNAFSASEILSETPASIVIEDRPNDPDWTGNSHVYQVTNID